MTAPDTPPAGAALVTGGGRGIGRAIALALAGAGYRVVINALAADEDVATTLRALDATGVMHGLALGDIADLEAHDGILQAAEAAVGPLTTLVNNAGVSVARRADLLEVTPESFDRCMAVNTRGTFFLTQAFARRLMARQRPAGVHHAVITITSSNVLAATVTRGEYCISKVGAAMGARLFALRLAAEGIGSYDIQPGIIETPMTAAVRDTYAERIAAGLTPVPRMGQPEDVARAALALARGDFAFSTGQAVQVDGGLTILRF